MDKDIRYSDKKIDESWKDQISREKSTGPEIPPKKEAAAESSSRPKPKTSEAFLNFLTSLGYQTMMHLGEIPNPQTKKQEIHLEAAREIIDLLIQLKEKTQGNLSPQEMQFFNQLLPELQLKFSQRA